MHLHAVCKRLNDFEEAFAAGDRPPSNRGPSSKFNGGPPSTAYSVFALLSSVVLAGVAVMIH